MTARQRHVTFVMKTAESLTAETENVHLQKGDMNLFRSSLRCPEIIIPNQHSTLKANSL